MRRPGGAACFVVLLSMCCVNSHSAEIAVLVWATGNGAENTPSVAAYLMILGGFPAVDVIDQEATVPLSTLTQYDAVVYFSNQSQTQDPVAIGDVLADYADTGACLVIASFAWANQSTNSLAGRIITDGISPFVATGVPAYEYASMDWNDGSAIFDGVNSLTTHFQNTVSPSFATVINATLDDGLPLVATKDNVVAVNFFPDNSHYDPTGDYDILFANAVVNCLHSLIFNDGFERGDLSAWDASAGK
ncbi:MAG: hypothetical protein K8R59_00675 [Thermoanaerobaculales bacterium]|nr:hypothetical protein [Thermoanaerobaculales bacterium]